MAASTLPTLSAQQWRTLQCEWLWVYRGTAPRVRVWSGEISVPPGLFFVESGAVKIRAEGQETKVPAGHAFFSAPGLRRQWFEPNTRLLSVGLRSEWDDGRALFTSGLNHACETGRVARLHAATLELFAAIHGQRHEVTYAEGIAKQQHTLEGWASYEAAYRQWFAIYVETLAHLGITPTPQTAPADRRMEQLRQWLNAWPLALPLNLDEAARMTDLSTRRVHALLSKHLGMTAQAYLEKRRLAHARQRLLQEDTAFKEIAFSLGFRHASHFTAWFRRQSGLTPTACRTGQVAEAA